MRHGCCCLVLAGSLSVSVSFARETEGVAKTALPEAITLSKNEALPSSSYASTTIEETAASGLENLEMILRHTALSATVKKAEPLALDLPSALALTEKQNLAVSASKVNQDVSQNTFHQSLSTLLPDLTGSYDHSRFKGAIQIFGDQTLTIKQTRIVPQLTASWKINPGGEDVFKALAARQRIKSTRFSIQETLQAQLSGVANEYYQFLSACLEVENAKLAIEEAEKQVALNTAKMKAGIGIKVDLMRAKADLLEQEQGALKLETKRINAEQALLNRLNLDSETTLQPTQDAAEPKILIPFDIEQTRLIQSALSFSPDIQKLDREMVALKHEARAVLSRVVPSVNLQTYMNWTGSSYDVLDKGLSRYGGIRVETRLFENLGTRIPLAFHAKQLEIRQKEIEQAQKIQAVKTTVVNRYQETLLAAKTIFKSHQALAVNQEAYRLAFGRYKAGVGVQLDVLNSHVDLVNARTRVINAILAFNQSQVDLLKALGLVSNNTLINGVDPDVFKP